jgi:tRNA1(Val) A37 N6-methylase TrmN6
VLEETQITRDTLLRGRVKLLQPRDGYRSNLDPVLLAGFLRPPFGRFLDIGCGTGALSFLLLVYDAAATGIGVEIQARLAELAEQGRAENGLAERWQVALGDARKAGVVERDAFALVATNPPFRPVGTGVLPPDTEKALAHHEVTLTLADWLDVAVGALRPAGRLATIFPFARWEELQAGLRARGFSVARSRLVVPRADGSPGRVLVEARQGKAEAQQEPPLVVHDSSGYTVEVRRMLGEDA